jgi:HK97 family phage prohead protease
MPSRINVSYNNCGEFYSWAGGRHFRALSLGELKAAIRSTFRDAGELQFSLSNAAKLAQGDGLGLRGHDAMQTRLAALDGMLTRRAPPSIGPGSYSKIDGTVEATLSVGAPVRRPFGLEILDVNPRSVDLTRVNDGGIPLLDSHQTEGLEHLLGRIGEAWFEGKALVGRISFNATPQGRAIEGMVQRGEIKHLSIGYRVDSWAITDADGREINPEYARYDDDSLTFTAKKWELLEASFVSVPADAGAAVRSL